MAAGAASRWSSGEESKPEIAFRLAICLVFVALCLYRPAMQWLGWRAAQHYVAVPVKMRKLEQEAYPHKGRLQYRYHVEYEYEVDGRGYRSQSRFLVDGMPSEQVHRCLYETLRKARDAHEPIMAWVDPEMPALAVLDRNSYDDPMYYVFAGIGMVAFLFAAAYHFLPRPTKPARGTVRRPKRSW